ncbi:MAG TPA: hypothetical protein VJ874_00295 [Candidatus Thermoplasmatota archaeon]|nr:hypothetical protein [Candidatus Thermoplasmatota archaeon]
MTQTDDRAASVSSATSVARRGRKRSGGTSQVPDDTVASYAAARAFLLGEWFGASLMVASFTLLYLFSFAVRGVSVPLELGIGLALLALGAVVYLRSRMYYRRVSFDYAPRWHGAAVVVAGSAGIFWFMLALLVVLTYLGVEVLPQD